MKAPVWRFWLALNHQLERVGHSLIAARDWLLWHANWLWLGLEGFVEQLTSWLGFWRSINVKLLLAMLPALLALLAMTGLAWAAWWDDGSTALRARYEEEGRQALEEKHYELARVCFERLAQEDGGRQGDLFNLARSLEGIGQQERADAIYTQLAPEQAAGYPRAQLRAAERLLQSAPQTADLLLQAERHLLYAVDGMPGLTEARILLGRLYLQRQQWDLAEKQLLEAVDADESAQLLLAYTYRGWGKPDKVKSRAEEAVRFFSRWAEKNPDDHRARRCWAEALVLLKNYTGAVSILERGWVVSPDDAYREALGRAYASWAYALGQDPAAAPGQRLRLLERGLEIAPTNPFLLHQVVELSHFEGPTAEQARAKLRALLAQGQASAMLHLCLGCDAYEHGQPDAARQHFELAFQMQPLMGDIANNLAWTLAHNPPVDLPRALKIITLVLDLQPQNPHYRETRGQILVRMGQWREAVTDLEYALPLLPSKEPIHLALADAYQHLGVLDLAAEHQKMGEKPAPGS